MAMEISVLRFLLILIFSELIFCEINQTNTSDLKKSPNNDKRRNLKLMFRPLYLDYKKHYRLRFDPRTLYRISSTTRSYLEENEKDDETNNSVYNNSSDSFITTIIPELEKISLVTESVSKNESNELISNIMKPQKVDHTLSTIGTRLKNLLLGTASTVVDQHKGKGFLNLFDVIQFENVQCSASSNGIRFWNGTCFHRFECETMGGISLGSCADGYGVCCIFKYSCGMSTRQETSYFQSPKFPLAYIEPISCVFTIDILKDVKQILLEFIFFELKRPTDGDCLEDQFVVSGQNLNFKIPTICGINTGQHIYVNVETSPERRLFLSVFGRSAGGRAFSIRITQIQKHKIAPDGCLQYYTNSAGIIKSFNYEEIGNIVESRNGSYFNNLNYAICIKRAPDKCTITYSNTINKQEMVFQLINVNEEQMPLVPMNQAGADVFNCPDDFIVINGIRLCGDRLNDGNVIEDFTQNVPVTEYGNGPVILSFRTDSITVGRGFKLFYYAENCV